MKVDPTIPSNGSGVASAGEKSRLPVSSSQHGSGLLEET